MGWFSAALINQLFLTNVRVDSCIKWFIYAILAGLVISIGVISINFICFRNDLKETKNTLYNLKRSK